MTATVSDTQGQDSTSRRLVLVRQIADEEARLARLDAEQSDLRAHLRALRAEAASLGTEPQIRVRLPLAAATSVPMSSADKVKLFRGLFRGREDVFPTRFVAKKTGKPGYAPTCRNKFVKGVCELPKVKCGDCPNQAFIPFDDDAVVGHLTGLHVMGVYPLLDDETCWFLAVDFDGKAISPSAVRRAPIGVPVGDGQLGTWMDDVIAFIDTCRRVGLPIAVERSRSGNGAHVWFFFSAPVSASVARKIGCYLITETMSRRHQLGMDSYDRLFPSQDTMPRGRRVELEALLRDNAVALEIVDERVAGERLGLRFRGKLTPVQQKATAALLAHDIGVFVAPPGVGKTVVGTYLVAERNCSTLILVHRRPLLDQWLAQLSLFLGIEPKGIGQIGAGKKTGNGRLDVAMIQSLARREKIEDIVASYGQIIVDECHHLPAISFERVLAEAKARYVVGLTTTPQRRDGHHPITEMQLGPVRFAIDPKSHAAQRPFTHKLVVRETGFAASTQGTPSIQKFYAALAVDEKRNRLILDDVIRALEQRRSPILLTERKDHLEYFAAQLRRFARHLVVLQGGMSVKERREVKERLASIPDGEERLVLATGGYIGEGFDDARLDTLFLALPVSWKGTLIQYTGRLHRLHPGKVEVQIFDYVDRDVPMLLKMFERRLRSYRGIGYARGEAPLGFAEPTDDVVVEYDQEVLRSLKDMDT